MDSVSQLALGAAVGYATLGRRLGRPALVWGAVLGTLPDLDVFVPLADPVAAFTEHRSWSHSLLVLALATPVCAALGTRLHRRSGATFLGWLLLAGLVLVTHVLLDCFTVYGTQVLWPFCLPPAGRPPESWSTVFVIDPAYTLPLLVGIGCAARWSRRRPRRAGRCNAAGLVLSSLYLVWTVAAKSHVESVVDRSLLHQGIVARQVLTTPTPLNSLLWRIVVMQDDGYLEGFHSLLADASTDDIVWTEHPCDPQLRAVVRAVPAAARLLWFTHGFCSVRQQGDRVVVTDLRMGSEPDYVFAFAVARGVAGDLQAIDPERVGSRIDWSRLGEVWERLVRGAPAPR